MWLTLTWHDPFSSLSSRVKHADLGVRDASAEVTLWVCLVFTIPVALDEVAVCDDTRLFGGPLTGKDILCSCLSFSSHLLSLLVVQVTTWM